VWKIFRITPKDLKQKTERTVYNRRKELSNKFNEFETYYIVDSMPLEITKLSRSSRSTICKESYHSSPNKGYCASQNITFNGYKIHAV